MIMLDLNFSSFVNETTNKSYENWEPILKNDLGECEPLEFKTSSIGVMEFV